MNEVTAGRVILGPEGIKPIPGVAALESAGLAVDPNEPDSETIAGHSAEMTRVLTGIVSEKMYVRLLISS